MTRAMKIVLGSGLLVGVAALTVAIALPRWVRATVDRELDRLQAERAIDVSVGAVDLSWTRHWPRLDLTFSDVRATRRAPYPDDAPLLATPSLRLSVDVPSLWSDAPRIRRLALTGGEVNLLVNEAGLASWSLPDAGASDGPPVTLDLDALLLEDLTVRYRAPGAPAVVVRGLSSRSALALGGGFTTLKTSSVAESLLVGEPAAPWLRPSGARLTLDGALDPAGQWTITRGEIRYGDVTFSASGTAAPSADAWALDVAVEAPSATVPSLLALLPDAVAPDAARLRAGGDLAISAKISGVYAADRYPGGEVSVTLRDGWIAGADVPTRVDAIQASIRAHRVEGALDATHLAVETLSFVTAGSPLRLSGSIAPPWSDPKVDLSASGRADLGAIDAVLGGSLGLSGRLEVDAALAGRASDVEAGRHERVSASGHVRGQGLSWTRDQTVTRVDRLRASLSPERVEIEDMALQQDWMDADIRGTVSHPIAYATGAGPLRGDLVVRSKRADLRSDASTAGEPSAIVAIPTDLDLSLDLSIGEVLFDDYVLTDVAGPVRLRDGRVDLDPLTLRAFGGAVHLRGHYAAPTAEHADLDVRLRFDDLSLDALMATMDSLAATLPVATHTAARVGGETHVRTRLLTDASPDLASLFSEGTVVTFGGQLRPAPIAAVADRLRQPKLGLVSLDRTMFGFTVERGRLRLAPTPLRLGATIATLDGSAGVVDHTLDLGLAVPIDARALAGLDLPLPPRAQRVTLRARITGPYDAPKLSLDVDGAERALDAVKDIAIDKAKEVASGLIGEAERRGDQLIAEAERLAQRATDEAAKAARAIRQEAKQQGDALIRAAKGKPLQEAGAKAAAAELSKVADREAGRLERAAEREAERLIQRAKDEKTKLVDEARARAR